MAGRQQEATGVQQVAVERLRWQPAGRDDEAVARAISAGEERDAVYGLEEAGWLDQFYTGRHWGW